MLFEVLLRYTYANQQCLNRWNYLMVGTPAAALPSIALTNAFGAIPSSIDNSFPTDSLMNGIKYLVGTAVTFTNFQVRNIYDVVDFYDLPYPSGIVGGQNGETMSPIDTIGFRTSRVRQDIRRGTKRFSGIIEGWAGQAGVITPAGAAQADAVAELMSDNLEYDDEGNTLTFIPCVVSKQKYTTPSGRSAYRYYPTLLAQMDHVAQGVDWTPYAEVRSQTSRQYGKGI